MTVQVIPVRTMVYFAILIFPSTFQVLPGTLVVVIANCYFFPVDRYYPVEISFLDINGNLQIVVY